MARRDDLLLVALAALHATAVVVAPSAVLIACGVWWNSNTIAHNFIHRPFFRARLLNVVFGAGQSVLLGIPQTLWRDRHLAHHAGREYHLQWSKRLVAESMLVCGLWSFLAVAHPQLFVTVYLPGFLAGLVLCAAQGHYEHAGATTSHYGRVYNALCFNDGYHVEHHAFPGLHWTLLPSRRAANTATSRWPPLLRWLEHAPASVCRQVLEMLERFVLRSRHLQRFVLRTHRNAFRAVLREVPPVRRVAIVGGGLFPRTAIVLRELAPAAEIVVIDASLRNVATARAFVGPDVRFEHARFAAGDKPPDFDLIVIPLAFEGDRAAIYRHPPAAMVVVHDWLWRRRGHSRRVSIALLKRLNLVRAA